MHTNMAHSWKYETVINIQPEPILDSPLIFTSINFCFNPLSANGDRHQFSPNISKDCEEIMLWELINWSLKRKCFDLISNSLNTFFKEMYRDQFGEFICGYWGLKG